MKKKFFAALSAAMLLCGALTAPAAAEQKYQMGDVNMDGEVSIEDPMLVLQDYTRYMVGDFPEHSLTEEQLALADINGKSMSHTMRSGIEKSTPADICDAQLIFKFYVYTLSDPDQKGSDIRAWVRANFADIADA